MSAQAALPARLWTYQAERFPLLKHGLLIAVFSGGEAVFGALVRGARPDWPAVGVAILVCLLLFAQLRIADEHKDNEEDSRWRPERPVPRGLVTLGELRWTAAAAVALQLAATLWLDPRLIGVLLLVWGWLALMSVEFLVPAWLKARPILYMVSHMAIMPLIALFAVACGARAAFLFSTPVAVFMAMAFLNGLVLEVARKSWGPESEREGVETYSRLWGPRACALVLCAAGACAALLALLVQLLTHTAGIASLAVLAGAALLIAAAAAYGAKPDAMTSGRLETASGLFVLFAYLGVAWLPAGLRGLA